MPAGFIPGPNAKDAVNNPNGNGSLEAADKGLRKDVSLTQLLLLGVSAQIGSGWLFGVLAAAGMAGPAAIASWLIAAVLVFLISLTYLELGSMLPRSGGIVRYTYLTHGAFSGWIIGWAYWLSVVTIPPIEAVAAVTYIGGKWPQLGLLAKVNGVAMLAWPTGILTGIVLMLLFFCLNYFGSRLLAESNRWVTYWKIALPTATFLFLFHILDRKNFFAFGGFMPEGLPAVFHAIPSTGIIFSLLGFRQALDYGGESRNPQRDVPIATFGSILIPTLIYTLLQVAFIGAIKWSDMGVAPGAWDKLVTGGWADGPLFHALESANIAVMASFGTLLLIDAAVSPLATGWVYLGTGARTGYGLSVHRSIPGVFSASNRFGIPWLPLLVSAVVGCAFFVPAPSWYKLVGFISSAAVMTYVMGGVGLPVLRRTAAGLVRPFRLHAVRVWSLVSFLAAVLLLYWSGFETLTNVFTATFVGLPLFSGYYAWKRGWIPRLASGVLSIVFAALWLYVAVAGGWVLTDDPGSRPGAWSFTAYFGAFCFLLVAFCAVFRQLGNAECRRHIDATWWLVWLCLGSMLVGYLGVYGPRSAHEVLQFPWGMVAEIAVGLIAWFWAVHAGFDTEDIREIVQDAARERSGHAA